MIENNILIDQFKITVWDYYRNHFRSMPWRTDTNPYYVMVSELMLQQTQVQRVLIKFDEFITRFPSIESLAEASLTELLETWIGLGYNRRARFLKQSADIIVNDFNGQFPTTLEDWIKLPGFGYNTACAVLVYSQNIPLVFIETNIRSVFIHHFYADSFSVDDKSIESIVRATLDLENPREWYWALMDYGSFLKKEHGNISRKSSSYSKQSKFEGSFRQKRATILKEIVKRKVVSFNELMQITNYSTEILSLALVKLTEENFIAGENEQFWIV